jgi:outer membrane protein assembly factor BamB
LLSTALVVGTGRGARFIVVALVTALAGAGLLLRSEPAQAAIAFRSAASVDQAGSPGSIAITKPAGILKGDVLIAVIAVRPDTLTITVPAGFTLERRQDQTTGNPNSVAVYRKIATASEPANYTFTATGNTGIAGGIMAFSGVDNTTPVDVSASSAIVSGTAFAAPSITTTVANTMIVTAHEFSSSERWTPPTGMTEAVDVASLAPSNSGGVAVEGNYTTQAAIGATGTLTANAAGNADTGATVTLALRPVVCGGTVADVDYLSATAVSGQATLTWSTPSSVVILRKTSAFGTERPADGVSYAVSEAIGTATVAYVGSAQTTTLTGLTNGTTYYYKIFAQDGTPCYSAGTALATRPAAGPAPAWSYTLAGGSMLNAGVAGTGTVYTSSNASRVVSVNSADGTQSWQPVSTNAAIQGTLTWLPVTAGIRAVQGGTATMTTQSTLNVPITAVTLARSVLWFSVSENNVDPNNGAVRGQLTSATNIQFNRPGTATTITIRWYVAEFGASVNVQRGSTALTATPFSIAIAPVDLSKTFVLTSWQKPGATYGNDDFLRARLTSTTTLELDHFGGSLDGTADWQVITMANASVQSGDVSFATGDTSKTVAVTSVNTSATFLTATWYGTVDGLGANVIRPRITSATQLTFDRGTTGSAIQLTWFLVTLTDGSSVQQGNRSFGTGATSATVTLSPSVGLTTSVAFLSGNQRGGSTPDAGAAPNDNPGVVWFSADLTGPTSLQLTRGTVGSGVTAEAPWFVVNFAATPGTAVVGGDQSGRVYMVDTALGLQTWSTTLSGADTVQAATAAQLRAYSNATFQSAYTDDVVFAATRNVSTTNNKVFALRASDGTVLWTFNQTGAYSMDYVVGMPWVDYARNRLYVASRAGGAGTQQSLWVINTLDGTLVQSFALGHLQTAPTVSFDTNTLYVCNTSGQLYAINLTTLATKWTSPSALGSAVNGFVWEDGAGALYFTTANGNVWKMQDPGAGAPPNPASPVWKRAVAGASSPLLLDAVYVGASDGKVHQVNVTTGVDEKQFTVGDGLSTVGSPSTEDGSQLFVGTAAGALYKIPLPLP